METAKWFRKELAPPVREWARIQLRGPLSQCTRHQIATLLPTHKLKLRVIPLYLQSLRRACLACDAADRHAQKPSLLGMHVQRRQLMRPLGRGRVVQASYCTTRTLASTGWANRMHA